MSHLAFGICGCAVQPWMVNDVDFPAPLYDLADTTTIPHTERPSANMQ